MKGPRGARQGGAVARRHVLFFGGYDPKGASWYHATYARHAALQSPVNGMELEVGPRRRDAGGRQYWDVQARDGDGLACSSRIEVVGWDAIVRAHWPRGRLALLRATFGGYARMLRHIGRGMLLVARIAPRTLFALAWPVIVLGGGALLALALAGLLAWPLAVYAGAAPAAAAFLGIAGAAILALARLERRLDTSLLARIFAFTSDYAVNGNPELDAVIDAAAGRIATLLGEGECDELLVAGYSVGSILAARAIGRALEREELPAGRPALALLTLGNCMPMLGLFPQAQGFRDDLARIAASDRLRWVDVSSPADWGSFPLLDPIEVCGIRPARRGRGHPLMTSPRFHALFSPARYAELVRDKHAVHTQYLQSTEKPGRYDWFAISAGPLPLARRYSAAREPRA